MKKLVPLAALLVATSVSAGDFDTVDVKLSATSNDWTIEHVVDGTDIKVKKAFSIMGSETSPGIPMSVAWSATDGTSTVSASAGIEVMGIGFTETVSWSEGGVWSTDVEAAYSMFGVDMTVTPSFDLGEMEYAGTSIGASYDVAIGDRLNITPSVTAPWDEDGNRSDISTMLKVSVTF